MMTPPSLLLGSYIIWRNTDLWDIFFRREQKYENMSIAGTDGARNMSLFVIMKNNLNLNQMKPNTLISPHSFMCNHTLGNNPLIFFGSFILLMLLQKIRGLSMDSFSDYRITKKHIHLLDGLTQDERNPQHSCVRIVDYWQWTTDQIQ